MQFSKKPILANFGDLPRGEIPEPLKFNRPYCKYSPLLLGGCHWPAFAILVIYYNLPLEISTLSNGIRVATEKTNAATAT